LSRTSQQLTESEFERQDIDFGQGDTDFEQHHIQFE